VTLLVALKGTDGLALAADSRGTFGDPSQTTAQNDSQKKAHVLSKHVAALSAGTSEIAALLIEEAKASITSVGIDGVSPVLDALRETCRDRYNEWFPTVPCIQAPALLMTGQAPSRPGVSFLVAGYEITGDGSPDTAKLFHLGSNLDFAPMLSDYGFAVEGIAQYALYLLNRLYQPGRSVQELTSLAVYVVTETASQDGKVGGPVSVVIIKPGTGCEPLDEDAVADVISENEVRSKALRDSFYTKGGADES
jgi:20S proteasome alpha/beta subunit